MPGQGHPVTHSDALVYFDATGDLAYKQIFPSLLGQVRDDGSNVPIVGAARSGWGLDQLKDRAKDSLAQHGAAEDPAVPKLLSLLHDIDGDYANPTTFSCLHDVLGEAKRPLHYLAVPPSLFGTVATALAQAGATRDAPPRTEGSPVALYEHSVFTQGANWAIGSFDQWSVELSKALASRSIPELDRGVEPKLSHDASTSALVARYRSMRA